MLHSETVLECLIVFCILYKNLHHIKEYHIYLSIIVHPDSGLKHPCAAEIKFWFAKLDDDLG